jgi:Tol biopolymer transport system component
LTIRMLYLPAVLLAAVLLACAAALLALSEKAEATFPGKNGRIAYQAIYGNALYTINPDGSGKTKVTRGGDEPSYSPDGKKIVYSSENGGIYTINVGGGGKTKVTEGGNPSFSPDGKRIAYECWKALISADDEDFDSEICTINVGGGGKSKVTNTKYDARNPSWGSRP